MQATNKPRTTKEIDLDGGKMYCLSYYLYIQGRGVAVTRGREGLIVENQGIIQLQNHTAVAIIKVVCFLFLHLTDYKTVTHSARFADHVADLV
jgi:hypothetical protein